MIDYFKEFQDHITHVLICQQAPKINLIFLEQILIKYTQKCYINLNISF
jgi:hypothetical protein